MPGPVVAWRASCRWCKGSSGCHLRCVVPIAALDMQTCTARHAAERHAYITCIALHGQPTRADLCCCCRHSMPQVLCLTTSEEFGSNRKGSLLKMQPHICSLTAHRNAGGLQAFCGPGQAGCELQQGQGPLRAPCGASGPGACAADYAAPRHCSAAGTACRLIHANVSLWKLFLVGIQCTWHLTSMPADAQAAKSAHESNSVRKRSEAVMSHEQLVGMLKSF